MNNDNFTKVIIEMRNGIEHIIIWLFIVILFAIIEYITLKRFFDCLFLLLIIIPLVLYDFVKKDKYLSEILIYDDFIQLVYKCRNVVVNTKNIKKQNIKNFHVDCHIPELYDRTYYAITNITIEVQESEPIVYNFSTNQSSLMGLFDSNWQTIINLVKEHDKIPNFSYNLTGNCSYAKAQIEQYYKTQKNFNIKDNIKIRYTTSGKLGKINTVIGIAGMTIPIILIIVTFFYLSIPNILFFIEKYSIPVTRNEQKVFMTNYNNAMLNYEDENYQQALNYFLQAENIYNKDSEIYLSKAYCYEGLHDYNGAIEEAKKALLYKENQSIYKSQYKIKSLNNNIRAYKILARNYYRLNLYSQSEDAYSYIIDNSKSDGYDNKYLKRGKCRYYTKNMNGAIEDFNKHKQIIKKYITDQKTTEFPDKEPLYNAIDIQRIDKWIEKCSREL